MRRRGGRGASAVVLAAVLTATPAAGQDLADFDYENLAFRGVGVEAGHLWASRVRDANTLGVRVDLGYLGPGLRIVPSLGYWSSELERGEVADLEASLEALVEDQTGVPTDVDLGTIDWSDLTLGLDGHVVFSIPYGLLSYVGAGGAVHLLNGDGEAIRGTFVEDLLDSARAGFNLHAGLEYPLDRFRLYGVTRFEMIEDLSYFEVRIGGQFMFGPSMPDEVGG